MHFIIVYIIIILSVILTSCTFTLISATEKIHFSTKEAQKIINSHWSFYRERSLSLFHVSPEIISYTSAGLAVGVGMSG